MCEPLTLAALAVGAAGAGANAIGQAKQAKAQKGVDADWQRRQEQNRLLETQRQEEERRRAAEAQSGAVKDLSVKNQTQLQTAEEARLNAELNGEGVTPTGPVISAADAHLTDAPVTGAIFKSDMAKGIADASAAAKQRIAAMATAASFGGSSGGLGTVNPMIQQRAGAEIDLANNKRRGSLNAFNIEQGVDPVDLGPYSNPLADVAQGFIGIGASGAGKSLAGGSTGGVSSIFGNAVKTPIPAGMRLDPLTNRLF